MKLQKRYFVGKNKPGIWASVYAYKPNNDEIFIKRGEIFAAVIIEGPTDFDSSIAGNLVLDILHETYFESKEESVLEALEDAVKAAKNRLLSLVENDDTAAINGINFDLVTLVVKDKYIFSVRIGDGSLKVYRDGSLQDMAAGFKDPTGEKNFEVLSTISQPRDVFFLSTPAINDLYTQEELLEAVDEYNEIGLKNKMLEDDSKVAFLMLGMDMKSKLEQEAEAKTIDGVSTEMISPKDDDDPVTPEELDASSFSDRKEGFARFRETAKTKLTNLKGKAGEVYTSSKNRIQKKKSVQGAPLAATSEVLTDPAKNDKPAEVLTPKVDKKLSTFSYYLKNFSNRIGKILSSWFLIMKHDLLGIKGDDMYLRGTKKGPNYRVIVIAAIVLIAVLFFAVRARQSAIKDARDRKQNETLLEELSGDLDDISASSVFTIDTPDNISSRESVYTSIKSLQESIQSTQITDEYKDRLQEKSNQLNDLEQKLLRVIVVESPDLVSDLGADYEGADPVDIAFIDGNLYVSDQARNVIYQVKPNGGQEEFITKDLSSPQFLTGDPDGDLVVLDKSDTALGLITIGNKSLKRFPGMTYSKLASAVEMSTYEVSDNDIRLYLATNVSPQVQQINKRGGSYSDGPKSRWDIADLSGLTDIVLLDGKFLMMREGEGLVRYFAESKITTNVTGLLGGDSLSSSTKIATDGQYIYMADSANKRVLVFTKSRGDNVDFVDLIGQYVYQGDGDVFSNIKDLVVDSSYIYVLDSARVYKLSKSLFTPLTF